MNLALVELLMNFYELKKPSGYSGNSAKKTSSTLNTYIALSEERISRLSTLLVLLNCWRTLVGGTDLAPHWMQKYEKKFGLEIQLLDYIGSKFPCD